MHGILLSEWLLIWKKSELGSAWRLFLLFLVFLLVLVFFAFSILIAFIIFPILIVFRKPTRDKGAHRALQGLYMGTVYGW